MFFPFKLFQQKLVYTFIICLMRATCPGHPILCDVITLIQFGEKYELEAPYCVDFPLISAVQH